MTTQENMHEVIETAHENVPYYQKKTTTTYTYTYRLGMKSNNGYQRLFYDIETPTLTIEEFAEDISLRTFDVRVFGDEMDLILYEHVPNRFANRLTIPYTTELENVVGLIVCNDEERKLLKDTVYNHLVKHFHFLSWDIYGNQLTQGHCEVHPHVGEEYPCFVCIGDKREYSIDRDRELGHHKLKIVECTLSRLVDELSDSFPLLDEVGLDPDVHHCEWSIQQERKRLHSIISKFRNQNGDGV